MTVKTEVKGDTLTLTIDLKERQGLSGSGNTIIIDGLQGKIGKGDITVNLSVYTKEGLAKAQLERAKENGHKSWAEYQAAIKAAKSAA